MQTPGRWQRERQEGQGKAASWLILTNGKHGGVVHGKGKSSETYSRDAEGSGWLATELHIPRHQFTFEAEASQPKQTTCPESLKGLR